eukprot:2280173-Rhodomonas_salina.2
MEHVAKTVGKSLDVVQALNFYDPSAGPVLTPFGDHIGADGFNWTIPALWQKVQTEADVAARSVAVAEFNRANRFTKRGIAVSPAKYVMHLHFYSSGALVNIYGDGTVRVSIGGSELGQGINTKVHCPLSRSGVQGLEAKVQGPGSRVQGLGSRVQDLGSRG